MRKEIEARVKTAIGAKVFPGCAIGIVRTSGERDIQPFGSSIYGTGGEEVKEDTVYDLASITKSIPTASLALLLIAEGKLTLSDTVKTYLPELQNDHKATVEDLLTYRIHGMQFSLLKDKTPDEFLTHVFALGFDGPRGEAQYSNMPAFLLGLIMERVGGVPLDTLAHKYFFDPLGMASTSFFPNASYMKHYAPTEIDERGKEIRGIVHDESARIFAREGRAVGHAGLFSTVPDLLVFLEALLKGAYMPVLRGAEKGLGWHGKEPNFTNFMGQYSGRHTFGKTGFTGTSITCDGEHGVAFVILSNRTYPKRPPDTDAINAFRRDIANIVLDG